MRADRLLSLLMLLQARGKITAQKLAKELEVSVRTVYRDIDALSAAGVPVYAERGPGGGCALIDGYRTSLTGLTRDEVQALFMLSVPAALDELGASHKLKAALHKLTAALPATSRSDEERVRQRIHLDWAGGDQPEEPVPYLQTMRQAVWEDRKLYFTYRLQVGPHSEQFEWLVDPYGLVAQAGVWHLIYAKEDQIRVHRVSRVLDVHITDEYFERPADLNLAAFWKTWRTEHQENRPHYPVTARVSPALIHYLPQHFGERIRDEIAQARPPDAEGWTTLTLPFETIWDARERILGFGRAVEVLEPEALRKSVIDFATQIVAFYARQGHRAP